MISRCVLLFFLGCCVLHFTAAQIKYPNEHGKEEEVLCANNTECTENFGNLSVCVNELCHCQEGAEYNPDVGEGECVMINTLRAVIGSTCVAARDCDVSDAICDESKKCVCAKDFILSMNHTKCLPLAKELDWGCVENIQCTTLLNKTTECKDMTCKCKSGTKHREGKCVESKGLDAYCESSAVCMTENAECSQGICACKNGYVTAADNARCIEIAHGFKAPCEEATQCTGPFGSNAECKDGYCVCLPGHHFSEMHCWQDKGLRAQCENHMECHIAEDGVSQRVECASGQCVCKQGYEADLENLRCSGVSPRGAGGASLAAAVSSLLLLIVAQIIAA